MGDKRREPRFKSKQAVWCEGQEQRFAGEAQNMSRKGMAIVTGSAAQVGSRLKVSFAVPEGGDVAVNMEVVWREKKPKGEPVSMGLRVVDFDKGQRNFNRFVNHHLSDLEPITDTDRMTQEDLEPVTDMEWITQTDAELQADDDEDEESDDSSGDGESSDSDPGSGSEARGRSGVARRSRS